MLAFAVALSAFFSGHAFATRSPIYAGLFAAAAIGFAVSMPR